MKDVCFIVPAHGRTAVSRVAFRALRWTMDRLTDVGVSSSAVVVACDGNVRLARAQRFEVLEMPNVLGAKLNAGYRHAAEVGAEYAVYTGSDDLLDPTLIAEWVARHRAIPRRRGLVVMATRESSVVADHGRSLAKLRIDYAGGDGVQLRPVALLERMGFEPTKPDRKRSMDGGFRDALRPVGGRFEYLDRGPLSIVDLKSRSEQLTKSPAIFASRFVTSTTADPWGEIATVFPPDLVSAAKGLYVRGRQR